MADQVNAPTTCSEHGNPVVATAEVSGQVVALCKTCATCQAQGCDDPATHVRNGLVWCWDDVIEIGGVGWPTSIVYRPGVSGGVA